MSFQSSILSAGQKQRPTTTRSSAAAARSQEPPLLCPRCDSPNTKFCYYNNYNLSQPRYFCKTCRRYWTKGGALRNVPIGGGCRKSKKMKYSLKLPGGGREYSNDSSGGGSSSSSSGFVGLKFFQGLSTAMDFQLACPNTTQFSSLGNLSNAVSSAPPCLTLDPLLGFSTSGFHEMGSVNFHSNLAAAIDQPLSSVDQNLHWQLQQQRLAMLFLGDNQKPQPNFCPNSDNLKKAESCPITPNGNLLSAQATSSSSNMVNDGSRNWNGIQSWTELTQFNSLP